MEENNYTPLANSQTIFSWKAPLRPYVERGKNVLRFYVAVALLVSLIVFFLGDKILLIPIWTLLFLFYALTITPPPEVENKITQFGINTAGATLRFEALDYFYFTKRFDYTVLVVVSHPPIYHHSYLVVPDEETKKKIIPLLSSHIIYQEIPKKTFVDRAVDWLSNFVIEETRVDKTQT